MQELNLFQQFAEILGKEKNRIPTDIQLSNSNYDSTS